MAAIVGIVTRRGLRIEVHHRSQPNKSKLALCKPLLHLYSHLKQLYISSNTGRFNSKGRHVMCGRTHIKAIKRRAGVGYRLTALGY